MRDLPNGGVPGAARAHGGEPSRADAGGGSSSAAGTPSVADARDRALVERVKRGEPGAWNDLLRVYQDRIYAVCLRMCSNRELAADLAQETMVKLVQHIEKYDGRCQFFTWVYRITVNSCLSRMRSEKLRRMQSLDSMGRGSGRGGQDGQSPIQVSDRPGSGVRAVGTGHPTGRSGAAERELDSSAGVEQEEMRGALLRAMQSLAEEHLTVLVLRDAQGLDYQQIADALEISVGTVKSRIFRARAALRDALEPPSESDGSRS